MGNKIIDSIIEWLKDEDSGDGVGYKRKDGTERGIVTSETNHLCTMIKRPASAGFLFTGNKNA